MEKKYRLVLLVSILNWIAKNFKKGSWLFYKRKPQIPNNSEETLVEEEEEVVEQVKEDWENIDSDEEFEVIHKELMLLV